MRLRNLVCGMAAMVISTTALADVNAHMEIGVGISGGGDTLAKIDYTNGDSQDVTAGGGLYIAAGPNFEITGTPFSVRGMLGYHVNRNSSNDSGANIKFDATTADLLVFYNAGSHHFGAGAYHAMSPTFHQSDFYDAYGNYYQGADVHFDDATGLALEYQYRQPRSAFGLTLRAVSISYKPSDVSGTPVTNASSVDGSFVALGLNVYF